MIPEGLRSMDLVGSELKLTRDFTTDGGFVVPKGTVVDVSAAGRGFVLKTKRCSCCGGYVLLRGVTRRDVEIVNEFHDKNKRTLLTIDELRDMIGQRVLILNWGEETVLGVEKFTCAKYGEHYVMYIKNGMGFKISGPKKYKIYRLGGVASDNDR